MLFYHVSDNQNLILLLLHHVTAQTVYLHTKYMFHTLYCLAARPGSESRLNMWAMHYGITIDLLERWQELSLYICPEQVTRTVYNSYWYARHSTDFLYCKHVMIK